MKYLLSFIITIISISLYSQDDNKAEDILHKRHELNIKFSVDTNYNLQKLGNIVNISNIREANGKLEVIAYLNRRQYKQFKKERINFNILKRNELTGADMCNNIGLLKQWACYPTYEQYLEIMQEFANTYPNLCKLVEFGTSVEGRKLLAVKISDNVGEKEAEPEIFYSSTMHGDETLGYILMIRLIDYILTNYNTDNRITELVNNTEIWINPLSNPDGTYRGGNHTLSGAIRANNNGVDLNRNFPDIEVSNGNSIDIQKENLSMMNFMKEHNFSLSANFHSGEEVVNYPWDSWYSPRLHADNDWYVKISRAYADTVHYYSPADYMTFKDNGITLGSSWYSIKNGRQDYVNYYLHGREVTIELSKVKNPSAPLLTQYWNYNYRSFINYMENVHKGVSGKVTDAEGKTLRAKITLVGYDKDSSEIYSDEKNGCYYRMLCKGDYKFLVTCAGYKDTTFNVHLNEDESKKVDIILSRSETSSIKIKNDKLYSLTYNNPVGDYLNISFLSEDYGKLIISVFNILGVQVVNNECYMSKGRNLIRLNFAKIKKGCYVCRLKGENVFKEIKVLKN